MNLIYRQTTTTNYKQQHLDIYIELLSAAAANNTGLNLSIFNQCLQNDTNGDFKRINFDASGTLVGMPKDHCNCEPSKESIPETKNIYYP